MEPSSLSEVFGNRAAGFGNKAAVTVAFAEFSLLAVWTQPYVFWPFWRWLLICLWKSLPRAVALKRSTGGSGQYPVAPEDTVRPGLCLAKAGGRVSLRGRHGWSRSC